MTAKDEFVMSVVIRRRDDLEMPVEAADAVKMVRELLEVGAFLDVVQVIGRRRSEVLDDTPDNPQDTNKYKHYHLG